MRIGYASVSKADGSQSLDLQRDALRTGDVLVVWKLDRLGLTLAHLVTTVQDLSARGLGLRVLTGQGAQIDTTTAGRLVFGIFAALGGVNDEPDATVTSTHRSPAAVKGLGAPCSTPSPGAAPRSGLQASYARPGHRVLSQSARAARRLTGRRRGSTTCELRRCLAAHRDPRRVTLRENPHAAR